MTRRVPISPEVERAALERALDSVADPAIPASLMARIMREVPLMAQLPAHEEPAIAARTPALAIVPPARHAAPSAARPVQHSSGARGPALALKRRAGWRIAGAGGFGVLAAGIVAVAMMGTGNQAALSPATPDAAPVVAAGVPSGLPPVVAATAARGQRLATARHPVAHQPRQPVGAKGAEPDPAELAPSIESALPDSSPPQALAVAVPLQPEPSDADGEGLAPNVGPRGQMGPVLQQGYGYTGGTAGGIPPGAPVRMSGGPGQH